MKKKQAYVRKSHDQKELYNQEKKRLSPVQLQTIDADEKSKRIQNRVKKRMQQLPTKRPRTAYAHYLASLDRGEADLKNFMKGAAQKWTQMSVEDKQKFEDMYHAEKQEYAKALVTWASTVDQRPTSSSSRRRTRSATKAKTDTSPSSVKKKTRGAPKKRASSTAATTKKKTTASSRSRTSDKENSSSSSDDDDRTPSKSS